MTCLGGTLVPSGVAWVQRPFRCECSHSRQCERSHSRVYSCWHSRLRSSRLHSWLWIRTFSHLDRWPVFEDCVFFAPRCLLPKRLPASFAQPSPADTTRSWCRCAAV